RGGDEMIARLDLAPITSSQLQGRTRAWGQELSVMDGAGHIVIEARLGNAAKPHYAVFRTAQGEWRVERTDTFVLPGPRRSGLRDRTERLDVLDSSGNVVAVMRRGQLTLADGENLRWVYPATYSTSCGLGGDLWVAKAHWPRRRGFRAELSGGMLAREDRGLLTGIAAMLTHTSLRSRRIRNWTSAEGG
ncbi:MAG: hypothetical protein ACXWEK_06715, partial [Solirubrobacterales bacterium]